MVGPEVVYVDIDKYKFYNKNNNKLTIEISACWFNMSQIESKNATIYINWKGYFYVIPISELMIHNTGCCDNVILNVEIDLLSNVITLNNILYVPIITTFSTPNKSDFNMSLGYLKVLKNDFNTIFDSSLSSESFISELSVSNKNNKLINYFVLNTLTQELDFYNYDQIKDLDKSFDDNFVIPWKVNESNIEYYKDSSLITNQFDYKWTDKIILNNNTFVIQNFRQCFVDTEFFKKIRR